MHVYRGHLINPWETLVLELVHYSRKTWLSLQVHTKDSQEPSEVMEVRVLCRKQCFSSCYSVFYALQWFSRRYSVSLRRCCTRRARRASYSEACLISCEYGARRKSKRSCCVLSRQFVLNKINPWVYIYVSFYLLMDFILFIKVDFHA